MGGSSGALGALAGPHSAQVTHVHPPTHHQALLRALCSLQLTLPPDYEQSINLNQMYSWFMRKAPHIRRLDVDLNSRSAWVAVHALLGTVGHYLTHLRIYGDEDSLWESGSTCPWLALTPNLVSLELENATDSSVEQADFPLGAWGRVSCCCCCCSPASWQARCCALA